MNSNTLNFIKKKNWKQLSDNKLNVVLKNHENLSKNYYQKIIAYDLILKQNYTSVMQLPKLDKIVLNTTSKVYVNEKKFLLFTLAALEFLSGQKPQLTYARKSVANFKIRQHQILGCKVVLRENSMYSFLDKLSKIIFPRIRDYGIQKFVSQIPQIGENLSKKSRNLSTFSGFTLGFQNLMIFPEVENHYELVENFRGLNLTFVISNSDKIASNLILSGFQLPV